jgi:hypothetical protein
MKFVSPINVLLLVALEGVTSFAPIPFVPSRGAAATVSDSFVLSVAAAGSPEDAITAEEEMIIELSEEDDDDFEGDERTFEDFYNEFMKVLGAKRRRDVAPEAQAIFDAMYESYVMSDEDPSLWPNATIYNILLDAHAWSPSLEGGEQAQHILDRMEDMTVETIARPNVMSYMTVMDAWGNRKAPEKAQAILDRMAARYEQTANPDVRPDTKVYNKLIGAWMKSNADDNAEQAEKILQKMMDQYEELKDSDNEAALVSLPNQKSFVQVMRCYGNRRSEAGLAKVRELFDTMKQLYLLSGNEAVQPDTQVYNELISAIANQDKKVMPDSAQQAEAVLYEMMEAANMGNDAMEPNAGTFRAVIYGYKGKTESGVAYKVEKLLELPQGLGVEVNAGMYNAAIQVISWTYEQDKAALCWKLVQRMKENDIEPTKASYNNVLSACGHTFEPKDPKEVFRIAIEAFNELRDAKYMSPDVTTYGHFLRCCAELLPDNAEKRDSVVKNIFLKCSNDGMVGRFVLAELMNAASPELVTELLGGKPEDGVKIPRKWSRSIKDNRQLLR